MDIQQVLPDISINDYDMLVREYYAPCKGLVVTVPVLPDTLKAEVVHGVHSLLCHSGFRRIVEVLSGLCWFPNILDETAAMLSNCDICSRQSRPMIVGHDVSIFSPDRLAGATPFSVVSADVVYLPAPYLSQQCAVSKYACLIKLDGEDAATIQQAFERSWEILGKRPVYLLTDNAAAFLACRLPNVTRLHTPARSSQSNGMIESLHRTVRRWMRAVLADDASMDVDAAVARVMRAYNTTCHSVTGRIPNDMFNADPAGVEWKRLVDHAVQLAEKKLISSTKHELYPGCIVRVRATTRFDKVVTNSNDTPFSERRWRVVGFPTSSGLITNAEDYGYFRKVKIVCDGEIKVLHASRLCVCSSAEPDVADLRRAMRRIDSWSSPYSITSVVRDVSWLLDRRASLRHVNINELCAAAQALIWASPYVNGRVVLHVDNECVRAWVSRFLKGEAVKKGGLASTIVSRRLQCIYDIAEVLQSLEVRRVESESNGSDILTRVDEKFLAILSSMEGDRHDRHGINVEADIGGAATVAQPGVRLLDEDLTLNHGAIIDAQYDDEVYYKVRRALRSGRLVPESVPMDIQQVLPDISINDYDMLVREYYAPCKGLVVTVPVLPDTLKAEVVHGVHSLLCHSGFRRIVEVLSGLCWFPNILDETAAMLSNCDICSRQSRPMIVGHDVSIFSPDRLAGATPFSVVSADVVRPHLICEVGGVPIEAAVDTGCDISLISIGFVKAQGWVMDDAGPSVSLTQMDGTGLLKTIGIIHLLVSFDESGTAQKKSVPHVFHVVPQTVLGAVVIGVDFAGRHLQGLRWNQAGKVQVGAAARVQSSDEGGDTLVNECRLPDLPGVHAHVYQSGKVVITADDFEVIREANDCHFTCRWIWRDGRGPSPMTMANRGDYNPSLTSEEEAQVTVEVEKMVSNGWVAPYEGEVYNILPWVLVSQPHKTTTPLRMCLDFRRLNRCLKSEPVRGIVNCPETLHRWRSVVHGYTLDVKKCYYAIHMAPCLYKYLCVLINQKVYCMKVLPFGLSVAPKVATAVISWLLRGIPYPISSFIDDIIIEDEGCGEREAAVEPESVRLVREALAKGNMYCKETCKIGESSRVLGLDLYREAGRLRWKRRADLDLEMDTSNPITRRELSAWCGRLIGHVPIAGWLRPCVAMLLRASSSGGWDSVVDESVVDLAACIYEKLQCEGDPASGIWFCPPSTSDEVVAWHIESDASGIAMGATLAYERQNGERVVVRDVSWLLDRRASLRHVNINELCAAAQALIWAPDVIE